MCDSNEQILEREYKTFEAETIVMLSTLYAIVSLILVTVLFRFLLIESYELITISSYAVISFFFLLWIGRHSRRRAQLNKLPSIDVIKLCYMVKEFSGQGRKSWHTTYSAFNDRAMERIFGATISEILPSHDYFSYIMAEKYIVALPMDNSSDREQNGFSISLSETAQKKLKIFGDAKNW